MRPANLIPPEERRSSGGGLRAAPVAYIIVGALLLALGGLTLLMTTNNQIADHKTEIAEARRQTHTAERRATELATYTEFHATAESRKETVTNLANSRFDWAKVMRQIELVQPPGVWLTKLAGSVRSGVSVAGADSVALRSQVPGPALSIAGCAIASGAVANYVTEIKEIEGVTRVGLQETHLAADGSSAGGQCTGHGAFEFQAVAAFDAAPIPAAVTGGEAAVIEEPVTESSEGEPAPEAGSESSEATTEGE